MAGFRRWYRRRYPLRYRRYYRRYRRTYARKFVNGSSKSGVRLKVPISCTLSFTQSANTQGSTTSFVTPFFSSTASTSVADTSDAVRSAIRSPLYRTYCGLYEEVKCIGMKIRLNVSSQVGGTDIPSLQIVTAFDRRASYPEMATLPTWAELKNYATYMMSTAVNNSVAKLERSIYASDLMERAQWHDCSLATDTYGAIIDEAYQQAGNNPNFFCPAFFVNMAVPGVTTQKTITTTCDIMYYFAFRNPKYGASAGSAKFTSSSVAPIIEPDIDMVPPLPDDDDVDELMDTQPIITVDKRPASGTTIVTSKTRKRDASDRPRAPRLN